MKRATVVAALATAAAGVLAAAVADLSARIRRDGRPVPLRHSDAILVFGAGVWPSGPSLSLRVRTARAADVYAEGWAPTILCSGGRSGGLSEASVMRALLVERGVPADVVLVDDGGTSTRAAISSVRAFGMGRWTRVIAVSSPYHLHRIQREARRQGIETILCPAFRPGRRTLELLVFDVRQHLRELRAVAAYVLSSPIETMFARGPGKLLWAAGLEIVARARWLAGGADALASASDAVADTIKAAGSHELDTATMLTPAAAGLAWPAQAPIISRFGLRYRRLHAGLDLGVAYGCPIRAAAGGRVLFADWLGPYGNLTVIDHGAGLSTVYAHQAGMCVTAGDAVTSEQVIGSVGSTGRSSGPHLHFEVRVQGTPVDPLVYLL